MLQSLTAHWRSQKKPIYMKEMAIGSAWIFAGNGLARFLTLAGSIIIARAIGKESFGEYSLALNTLNMLAEAVTFGAGLASSKYISEFIHKDKAKVAACIISSAFITLILSLAVATLLVTGKDYIAQTLFLNSNIAPCLNAVALGIVGAGVNGTLMSVLSGLKKFKLIALMNSTTCFVLFCLQALAATTQSLVWVTYATASAYIIVCIAASIIVRRELIRAEVPLGGSLKPAMLKVLYRANLPAFLSGLTVVPATWIANILLARQSQGYAELAVYSATNQWRNILLFIPATLAAVALPILSGQAKQDANKLLFFSLGLNALITLVTCTAVYPFAAGILSAYGNDFSSGSLAFSWMLLVVFLISINSALATYLTSQNKFWSGTFMNCLWALCFLLLCQWLIPAYKVLGLIYAYLGSYTFHLFIQTLQIVHIYGKQTHTHH